MHLHLRVATTVKTYFPYIYSFYSFAQLRSTFAHSSNGTLSLFYNDAQLSIADNVAGILLCKTWHDLHRTNLHTYHTGDKLPVFATKRCDKLSPKYLLQQILTRVLENCLWNGFASYALWLFKCAMQSFVETRSISRNGNHLICVLKNRKLPCRRKMQQIISRFLGEIALEWICRRY